MELTWLSTFTNSWLTRVSQHRVPHAVLLLGSPGVGKRAAAAWLARERFSLPGSATGPQYPLDKPEHPDLHWISPPDEKYTVGIDQIRGLVSSLALTSYAGGGKVAVIEPANAMTVSAANSLLKTLEEPSGDALIILIADRLGRLPATIVSRCQRISMPIPAAGESLDWLERLQTSKDWPQALALAGGAPLAAIDARERLEMAAAMATEFAGLAERRGSPIELAARWSKYEPVFVLDWLCQTVQHCIRRVSGGETDFSGAGPPESVLRRIDTRNLFCYLDIINRLRGQAAGSYNVQLTLESLLIDWAGGLKNGHQIYGPGELLPGTASG